MRVPVIWLLVLIGNSILCHAIPYTDDSDTSDSVEHSFDHTSTPSARTLTTTPEEEEEHIEEATRSPPRETTTTTERTPLAFENYTTGIIRQTSSSVDQLHLDLLRYETQLNLNTLDTLLPSLEGIRQNMSRLLKTPSQTRQKYEEQSQSLDNHLTKIETQIKKNRELQTRYESIQRDTQKQLGVVYESLGTLLNSQVYILSHNPGEEPSVSQIRLYMDHARTFYGVNSTQEIFSYLQRLEHPESRFAGYSLFFSKFPVYNISSTLLVQVVGELFKYPELEPIQAQIPEILCKIFTPEPKSIEMRLSNRQLGVRAETILEMMDSSRERTKYWAFYPVDDENKFFAIVYTTKSKALGVIPYSSSYSYRTRKFALAAYDESTKINQRYQWKITPYSADGSNLYLRFMNRETADVLHVEGAELVPTYLITTYSNQYWELH